MAKKLIVLSADKYDTEFSVTQYVSDGADVVLLYRNLEGGSAFSLNDLAPVCCTLTNGCCFWLSSDERCLPPEPG